MVFARLTAYSVGSVACVCRHWRQLAEHPRLWEGACREAFQLQYPDHAALSKLARTVYRGSWRRMFLEQPHLRFDGVYVSRNTYVKTGAVELSSRKTVSVVAYYRYYRFFPNGTLLYRTSPATIGKVHKSLRLHNTAPSAEHVYAGRYALKGTRVYMVVVYPNSRSTEIRSRLLLRSTTPGAFNRLDIESIVSYDHELGAQSSMLASEPPDPYAAPGGAAREHRRGMTTCVLVPWEQSQTSVLNLPTSKMDIFITG